MRSSEKSFGRYIAFGLIGGFLGTVLMDLIIVSTFLLLGLPGDGFFAMVGENLGQGAIVGIALHNIIGLTVGFIFALFVFKFKVLEIDSMKKGTILGFSLGALTIPLGCIPLAIWIGLPILDVISFSVAPHLVYGTVLGIILAYGALSKFDFSSKTIGTS